MAGGGWAVASAGLNLWGASQSADAQRAAGEAQRAAGEATAVGILMQSEETKRRMRAAQKGTMGTAIARAAASGITFDAGMLEDIEYKFEYDVPEVAPGEEFVPQNFLEWGGEQIEKIGEDIEGWSDDIEAALAETMPSIPGMGSAMEQAMREQERQQAALAPSVDIVTPAEPELVGDIRGAVPSTSLEAYVHRAKETHAREIAWEEAWAESQAQSARMGGQVAYESAAAAAQQTQVSAWGQALNTGYQVWGKE